MPLRLGSRCRSEAGMKSDRQEALHRPEAARIVVTRYSLHHLLAPLSPLREMARVCVPDGRIVVVDAYAWTPITSP